MCAMGVWDQLPEETVRGSHGQCQWVSRVSSGATMIKEEPKIMVIAMGLWEVVGLRGPLGLQGVERRTSQTWNDSFDFPVGQVSPKETKAEAQTPASSFSDL